MDTEHEHEWGRIAFTPGVFCLRCNCSRPGLQKDEQDEHGRRNPVKFCSETTYTRNDLIALGYPIDHTRTFQNRNIEECLKKGWINQSELDRIRTFREPSSEVAGV